ncbi:MAG: YjbE family putative metal transport protein [Alicyclobacillus macrosporangiidus]|uniref:YjbE family putative metal transport protein n=1 Tax=Alicyclobacillus macrosporangiidus TaxID=392015 RepID=UPI0026F1E70D|nr:YjbE family putative metal transport protein [Alicyclobacillus macrosporangiidus]MCL6599232.1 YjbE family putative metal transport protein [Alicyclobacillus macrosporangiidus]
MDWILLVANVALVNIILSGDNALAISLAASRLPEATRKRATTLGSTIAILLLILFTAAGTFIIRLPVLKTIAGVTLWWIAVRLVLEHIRPASEEAPTVSAQPNQLWKAIGAIVVADLGMELDNAMAMLGAADGRLSVLLVGFLFTIPFLIFGSRLISKVFDRLPWIVYLAAAYITWIAGRMAADDPLFLRAPWHPFMHWVAPVAFVAVFVVAILLLILWFRHRAVEPDARPATAAAVDTQGTDRS